MIRLRLDPEWSLEGDGWSLDSAATVLAPAVPNPLVRGGKAVFEYALGTDAAGASPVLVTLAVHDVDGRLVRVIENGLRTAGTYRPTWDGTDVNGFPVLQGTYDAKLRAGPIEKTVKVVIIG
jgi:hypothetical protein